MCGYKLFGALLLITPSGGFSAGMFIAWKCFEKGRKPKNLTNDCLLAMDSWIVSACQSFEI